MSDLITKEELLELEFVCCGTDVYFYDLNGIIRELVIQNGEICCRHLSFENYHTGMTRTYRATKANVLKLIEIAKLIGELE